MRLVIDTNIWIRLLQKEKLVGEQFARALSRGAAVLVPTIVQFEVMRGLHRRRDRESIRFVRELWRRVRAIEMSAPIWSKAVRLWAKRQPQVGRPVMLTCSSRPWPRYTPRGLSPRTYPTSRFVPSQR